MISEEDEMLQMTLVVVLIEGKMTEVEEEVEVVQVFLQVQVVGMVDLKSVVVASEEGVIEEASVEEVVEGHPDHLVGIALGEAVLLPPVKAAI